MNLSFRFARAYAFLVFFVLMNGFAILYFACKRTMTLSTITKLENLNNKVSHQLQKNCIPSVTSFNNHQTHTTILLLQKIIFKKKKINEQCIWNKRTQSYINKISVTTYPIIRERQYLIVSVRYITIIEFNSLLSILMVIAWLMVFLIILMVVMSIVITKNILEPLYQALHEIKKFNLKDKQPMNLMKTKTEEFRLLNKFLLKMSENAKKDYNVLEEISENTSHELQTPLASIKGKIELLMDSDLSQNQITMISSMNDELDRLASINKSLILLAKLEHFENKNTPYINFSELLKERLFYFEDIFTIQNLTLITEIQEDVYLNFDKDLAVIVINNVINNSTKHNIENGKIFIRLTDQYFEIFNTGNPPIMSTEELFKRFKRGNPTQNSIGIGLALVKKILEIHNKEISYHFVNKMHFIKIQLTN